MTGSDWFGTVLYAFHKQDSEFTNIVFADYSGKMINLRSWDKDNTIMNNTRSGDILTVLGRLRIYQGIQYIQVDRARIVDVDFEIFVRAQRVNPQIKVPRKGFLNRLLIKFREAFRNFLIPVSLIN